MGHEIHYIWRRESRNLLWLIVMVFVAVLMLQYFELPYGHVVSSLFSTSNAREHTSGGFSGNTRLSSNTTVLEVLNSTGTNVWHKISNKTKTYKEEDMHLKNDTVSEKNKVSDNSPNSDEDIDPEDEPSSDDIEQKQNLVTEDKETENGTSFEQAHEENGSLPTGFTTPLFASPPIALSPHFTPPVELDKSPNVPVEVGGPVTPLKDERPVLPPSVLEPSQNNFSIFKAPAVNTNSETAMEGVVSISEMNNLLIRDRASSFSMKPLWSSPVDRDLLNAKSEILRAPLANDPGLHSPLYRNVSTFKRSYEIMEQKLKVYIYKDGKKPIFHQPVLKGIYASEGWFMKLLKANKHFVTKTPRQAHLFYLPFSSRMLEETLYIPDSHSHKNLIQYLKNYINMITASYPFWNRTGGADHFLVACHDWAPSETKVHMAHCIRALCNSDIKEGFNFGKDVSLPETYVRAAQNPLRKIGGKPPSQRQILAFFAGNMHGYLRPILLKYWENKDPDMKIVGRLPKSKGKMTYAQYMKSSRYCICAKGYEVNSPRVVEAIFYECVPVIISDNFVPPFFEILNWEAFSVFVLEKDIPNLKNILQSIPEKKYVQMQQRVKKVQQHFLWHPKPVKYDIFHMILHSIWYKRVFQIRAG